MCIYTLTDIRRMERGLDLEPLDLNTGIDTQDYAQWLDDSLDNIPPVVTEGCDNFLNLYTI